MNMPKTIAEQLDALEIGQCLPVVKEQSIYSAAKKLAPKKFSVRADPKTGFLHAWRLL